jgi:threonine/homoserine/homoserine lactone efflux protein
MTQSRSRAAGRLMIWVPVLALFLAVFFGGSGPAGFSHDRGRIVGGAAILAAGYLAFFAMLLATRSRRGNAGPVRDERDDRIESRAAGLTLGVCLAYVFALSIGLWTVFQEEGSVPAGWMWFLAYTTVFLSMIVHAAAVLASRWGGRTDGEG